MEYKVAAVPASIIGVVLGILIGLSLIVPNVAAVMAPSLAGAVLPLRFLLKTCCLWTVAGGWAAASLYRKKAGELGYADGATAGGIFGLVYGVIVNVLGFLVGILLNMLGEKFSQPASATVFGLGGFPATLIILAAALLSVVLAVLFGTVGAAIYVAYRRYRK
jgi:hypothetical protein